MKTKEEFFAMVGPRNANGCRLWQGGLDSAGHGHVNWDGTSSGAAHRIAYALYHGSIPDKKFVLHTCDVRACVAKEHLYAGTQRDNVRDMIERKRQRSAPRVSELMAAKVKNLFRAGMTRLAIASAVGIDRSTVSRIVGNGKAGRPPSVKNGQGTRSVLRQAAA